MAMQIKHPIGILGATGMVGQRFIQLLENHPWFEVAWLAASDRSSGKPYGEAAKWRLDTPLPERIANMTVSPAEPDGAPGIIFASVDAAIARELEPRFANAGCAVLSNSSAFRMTPNVPLVIPEVNAGHLHLIEEQPSRKQSGGYMVTNPNCSTIGLVMALKPLEERFGIEQIFVTTMQAVSGAGYPGVASMDILGNVVPYIGGEEEKMEAETLKLLGRLEGHAITPLAAKITAHCNRVPVMMATPSVSPLSWGRRPPPTRFFPRGTTTSRSPATTCRSPPISLCNSPRSLIVRSRASIATAREAWPSLSDACARAACSTGSSFCFPTTPCAALPALRF